MIFVYILLAVLLVTVAAIVCMLTFDMRKNKTFRFWIHIGIIISSILIAFSMILGSIYCNNIDKLKAQYNDIMLYHEIVSECNNEQVRFGHYEKISEFNKAYNEMVAFESNAWFGSLLPSNWSEDMAMIDFYFRGVNYGGIE